MREVARRRKAGSEPNEPVGAGVVRKNAMAGSSVNWCSSGVCSVQAVYGVKGRQANRTMQKPVDRWDGESP